MASSFHQLLAVSLQKAKAVADQHIVQSAQLQRVDRERLIKGGCLQKIVRGWYLLCPPNTLPGESTLWHANFWDFIRVYLQQRFASDYYLSAESSMDVYLGKNYLPQQVVVGAKKGGNLLLQLPHNTSLLVYQQNNHFPLEIIQHNGLNLLSFEYALCRMPASFYTQQSEEAEIAIGLLKKTEKILHYLLKEGMVQAAGRLSGALRHLGRVDMADTILNAMNRAGFIVKEANPFKTKIFFQEKPFQSPYSARIIAMWEKTRKTVIRLFPKPEISTERRVQLINQIDEVYSRDAYHSLSIEGYEVSEELIAKFASGAWNPDSSRQDNEWKNAMAAKGYYEAFQRVKITLHAMLAADNPVAILQKQFSDWYTALFSPAVQAGIISATQLAGYRQQAVYIRNAMHVPPPHDAVYDCMESLFSCMNKEESAAVKAVLTHWLIGFIHPYVDGNGRMARFAMNAFLVTNGYPWAVVEVQNRKQYLDALEKASLQQDIQDFCQLIIRS